MVVLTYAVFEWKLQYSSTRKDDRLADGITEESPIGLDNLITLVQQGFRGSLLRRSKE
jgi:hypothetical protein